MHNVKKEECIFNYIFVFYMVINYILSKRNSSRFQRGWFNAKRERGEIVMHVYIKGGASTIWQDTYSSLVAFLSLELKIYGAKIRKQQRFLKKVRKEI